MEADHVPVDANPAYMMVQRIDLSNNNAYATTTSLQHTTNDYEDIVFEH